MTGALLASPWATWAIAAAATAGVIVRPFSWPEWVWAVAGAVLLVVLGLLPGADAVAGAARGTDVYLFLIGMMLLAELARQHGLFDWLAAQAARLAHGSGTRLFTLVFGVGTVVTVFLSNDATAVVLTPAVAAVARAAKAEPAALPVHLRLHRQRRLVRAADLQPGQPGHLWRAYAAAAGLAAALRPPVAAGGHGHLRRAALDAAGRPARRGGGDRGAGPVGRRAGGGVGHRGHGGRAAGVVGPWHPTGPADVPGGRGHGGAGALAREGGPGGGAEGGVLGRAAPGRRAVRAGGGAGPDRRHAAPGGWAARPCAALGDRGGVGRRAGARLWLQRGEQPARRAGRRPRGGAGGTCRSGCGPRC